MEVWVDARGNMVAEAVDDAAEEVKSKVEVGDGQGLDWSERLWSATETSKLEQPDLSEEDDEQKKKKENKKLKKRKDKKRKYKI